MIKAVLFDFGQTLVDSATGFRLAEKQAQDKIFQALAITCHEEFMRHYRRIRGTFHEKGNLSRAKIWQEVYWYYCREAHMETLRQWDLAYWQTVKENTQFFPETLEVLRGLSRSYRIALLSNTQAQEAAHAHRIQAYPELAECFELVVIAGENDVPPKPDARAFELCLTQLQIAPEEAVHVGDDWRNDICGARKVGIQPVWLKHRSVRRNYPDVQTDVPVITSLDELAGLLVSY